MRTIIYYSLFVVMSFLVGCTSDVEVPEPQFEKQIEEIVADEPQTRGVNGVITDSKKGGDLTGPNLEHGGVLYINKSYSFKYNPGNIWVGPDDASFIEVAIGVSKGGQYDPEYKISQQTSITMNHTFTEPGTYTVKGMCYIFG